MRIEFEKPVVPNFVRTDVGVFSVTELSEKEVERYLKLFEKTFKQNIKKKNEIQRNAL